MALAEAQEFFIQLHLTERCNLRCRHCYQTGQGFDEMSFEEVRALISEAAEMIRRWSDEYGIDFTPSFTVTGGEPLLRYDLFDILAEMDRYGFETYLLSNGIFIDAGKAELLRKNRVRGVQVSIEGPEEVHDEVRGKGSFRASITGVRRLLDAGMPVTLNTTLSEMNAGRFKELVEIARSEGVQRLGFSRLVPSGRGKQLLDRLLDPVKVRELYEEISSIRPDGLSIVSGDPVYSQMGAGFETTGDIPLGGCAAGLSGLTIMPDGTVTPCRRLPVSIGNVRHDSLREIWATSDILNALRDRSRYGGRCGSCKRWDSCRGCRAIAYACSQAHGEGDILAEDPQCFIEA